MAKRLKKGDITLREVYLLSLEEYKKQNIDDKKRRAGLDVISARLTNRTQMFFNRKTGKWEQGGLNAKFTFRVKSDPISYERKDKIKQHFYPVTFLIRDVNKGLDSPFRWRTGSTKKWLVASKGASKEQKQKIINKNIKNEIQAQFLFHLEAVLSAYKLLFSVNRAKNLPKVTNPQHIPYFDKTALFVLEKLLIPMLTKEQYKLNQIGKNKGRSE